MYTRLEGLNDIKDQIVLDVKTLNEQIQNGNLDSFDLSIVQNELDRQNFRLEIVLQEIEALSE
jgi:hypothetical protein